MTALLTPLALLLQADSSAAAEGRQAFWEEGASLMLPPQESTTAHQIDALFNFVWYGGIILTAFVTAGIVYFVWKYRRKSHADRTEPVRESHLLELSWIVLPTILVLVVFFWGFTAYLGTYVAPNDSYEINVKGQKWFWTTEYDNGVVLQNEIVVPANRPIKLIMTSQDVLHSFYVPEFRIKHDVIPNAYSFVWFEAPREGVYQVLCTEYCGSGHSIMGAKVRVVGQGEFEEFLRTGGGASYEGMSPIEIGESVYTASSCNTCHSVDGSAGNGPSWQGVWGQARPGSEQGVVNDEYVHQAIRAPGTYIVPGYQNQMPVYGEALLSDLEIEGISAYIRDLSGAATEADRQVATAEDAAEVEGEPGEGNGDQSDPSAPMGFDPESSNPDGEL